MENRFLTKEFKLVGVEEKINFNGDFAKTIENLQGKLFNKIDGIKNIIDPDSYTAYWFYKSSCCTLNQEPDVYYFAAVEVNEIDSIPEGLTSKIVPKSEYVVFNEKRRGEIGGPEGYAYIEWLPNSGRGFNEEISGDFEVYHSRTNIGPKCECEIYIPIK